MGDEARGFFTASQSRMMDVCSLLRPVQACGRWRMQVGDVCSVSGTCAGAMPATSVCFGGGETETVAQAGTHRGGRCGRGRSVVEEGEVEAVVRVVSKRVEDVGVEPVLKHRAAEWVR